jgi:dihydrofolate reductase
MHISLDGFVAGPNGEMDWIKVNDDIFDHVGKRINEVDTALYGRVTYQLMESYWPVAADSPTASKHDIEHSKWYADARKIVLSKTIDGAGLNNTEVIGDHVVEQINEIKQQQGEDILIFGSPTATHYLMRKNMVDGFWLFVNPVILGRGTPLFEGVNDQINLDLLSTRQFDCGVTELCYNVDNTQ